jgi:hypothetical protein
MRFTSDKSKFFQISPAAAEIFDYLRENPEVAEQSWEFDKGFVSGVGLHTYTSADFWFGALSGWGKDKLTISASKNEDGSWQINHKIERSIP